MSFLLLTFSSQGLQSQNPLDTLNKFNANNKKQGYWTFYYDSLFNVSEIATAKYYGFNYYENGKGRTLPLGRLGKKDIIEYAPLSNDSISKLPVLLNGTVFHYEFENNIKKIKIYESFKNGHQSSVIEHINWHRELYPEIMCYYQDSLFQNDPNTYLYYQKERNTVVYKEYRKIGKSKPIGERIYLVPHQDFKYIFRPIVGLHTFRDTIEPKPRNFLELGFSKKFISGSYVDSIDMTYKKDRTIFHSLNFSLMASNTYKKFCLGQKVTYGFNLFLIRAEAGLINYTDFKTIDLAATFGIGLSVFGYFNEMLYFSLPLATKQTSTYPRISFSIVIN